MNKAPLVSVCIPTYNGREYLEECLRSVRGQTFPDFEVVICDDQSSDGTLDLARQLAGDDPRFRFIANPRRHGLVGNWNNCVAQARGDWIKFVFQDDHIGPACLEKLLAACRSENRLFGFCERDFIFEAGVSASTREWFDNYQQSLRAEYGRETVIDAARAARILLRQPSDNPAGEPTVTLIHKSVFQKLGGFDEALIQLCDSEFWCRVLANYGAARVPESLASFRIHARGTTARNQGKRVFRLEILDPLVLRHRIAFDRRFKSMRDSHLGLKAVMALRAECARQAAYAWWCVLRNYDWGDGSQVDSRKEWREVEAHCSGLQALAWLGFGVELLHRFGNILRRFSGRNRMAEA